MVASRRDAVARCRRSLHHVRGGASSSRLAAMPRLPTMGRGGHHAISSAASRGALPSTTRSAARGGCTLASPALRRGAAGVRPTPGAGSASAVRRDSCGPLLPNHAPYAARRVVQGRRPVARRHRPRTALVSEQRCVGVSDGRPPGWRRGLGLRDTRPVATGDAPGRRSARRGVSRVSRCRTAVVARRSALSRPGGQRGPLARDAALQGSRVIACRTLGPVEVSVNGAAAPRPLTWHKHLALLIYLARSPKRARTRDHLIGLLWSEKPEGPARGSLNEAVRILRQSVGDGLESDATQVRIAPGAITLDLDTFDALVGAGDDRGAAALVQGEFLEGFSVEGASEFDNWLAAEREHWRRRSVDVCVRYAEQLLASGQVAAALDVLQRAQKLDLRPETALRAAMRALERGHSPCLSGSPRASSPNSPPSRMRRRQPWRSASGGRRGGRCRHQHESHRRRVVRRSSDARTSWPS